MFKVYFFPLISFSVVNSGSIFSNEPSLAYRIKITFFIFSHFFIKFKIFVHIFQGIYLIRVFNFKKNRFYYFCILASLIKILLNFEFFILPADKSFFKAKFFTQIKLLILGDPKRNMKVMLLICLLYFFNFL